MPELAEAEHFRRRWNATLGETILKVEARTQNRVFRGSDPALFPKLKGATYARSECRGKQILFVLEKGSQRFWLGIHLGMAGSTRLDAPIHLPQKHDYLVLHTAKGALIFNDQRFFGRVRLESGKEAPLWWTEQAPDLLSKEFTVEAMSAFLKRRAKAPLKAVLLMQERFPGVGNWMADEILWRCRLHPSRASGTLDTAASKDLHKKIQWVCRKSYELISPNFDDPPKSWLFPHRWKDGGHCPKCHTGLQRQEIGGRTTCWCPRCQPAS
jgi:formamidopyrimidine-DNA glycosylase